MRLFDFSTPPDADEVVLVGEVPPAVEVEGADDARGGGGEVLGAAVRGKVHEVTGQLGDLQEEEEVI